ncbi:MAG: lysylphosphatidylglycerol synthase transmembrane domain-containing protein [Vicinamibacterales bacterium]
MTKRALFVVQAVVTLALLIFLFRQFDWAALAEIGSRLTPAFYLVSFGALVAGQAVYAWRWKVVLAGMGFRVPYADVVRQYLVGLFFSNLMPTAVGGDAAKVFYLGRRIGFIEAGASVLVDRFLGFFWLAMLGAALSWTSGADTPLLILNRNLLTGIAALFAVLLALIWAVPVGRVIPPVLRRSRLGPIAARFEELAGHVRAGGCRPATFAASGAVVLAYVVLLALVYRAYFMAAGLTAPTLLPTMNVIVSMSVFVNLPISVGGIGLREQLHYLLFAELGVPKEVSVSLSLLFFAYSLALGLAGYVIWLRMKPAPAAVPA